MALKTRFTEMFDLAAPIQLAPMGGVTNPDLVAAVIEGGGMGALGSGPMPAEALEAMVGGIRAKTDGPLVINVLVPVMQPGVLEVAAKSAQLVDFFHGPPQADLVAKVHAAGAMAEWQVGSLEDARAAEEAGCDIIVVRGVEGGGRMYGRESLWPLLAEIIETVKIPVLAAGGIGDGRGLAAALAAGAAGVRMGTRFVACAESAAHERYRDALIAASAVDTVLTDEFKTGWPHEQSSSRVLRASLEAARAFEGDVVGEITMGPMTAPVERLGVAPPVKTSTGAIEAMAMYAGESVRFVREVEPAAEIVRSVAAHAEKVLAAAECRTG